MTISDRDAIRELLYAYCQCVDTGDADGWADLFTDDGTFTRDGGSFDLPDGAIVGRAALHRMASKFLADGLHVSANEVMTIDDDQATVTSYVLVLHGDENPGVRLGGRYHDQLRKVNGRWLFSSRRLAVQMQRT
jgi:uncharacterized protein (TIGR02246 family)